MTISLDPDADRRWLVARATGELEIEEALRFLRTVRSAGDAQYGALLFDARGATTRMTDSDVQRAVQQVAAIQRTSGAREHVAIVADDDILYTRMLQYEVGCAEIGVRVIRVFHDLRDAERWLSVMVSARHLH